MNDFPTTVMLLFAMISAMLLFFCVIGIIGDIIIDKKSWRDL